MFKQTEEKYRSINMGFGSGSIYDFGCYLVSFTNGLNQKGYSFTPESMNEMLKAANAWVGQYRNYIDVDHLDDYFPNIFKSFRSIEPWNDVPTTNELLSHNLVVVCKVDARGIGGTGTHFVLLVGIEGGVAVIHDPWTGKTEKVTVRYNKYGNILSVRIFEVIPYQQNQTSTDEKNKEIETLKKEIETLKNNQNEAIKQAVLEAVKVRDQQWQTEWDKRVKEKDQTCDNKIKENDIAWQQKLDAAKTEALAGVGGLELLARGIGKIITGKI